MTPKNPWKHVKVDPARLENNRFLNPTEPVPPTPSVDPVSEPITGAYILMPKTTTEVQGIHALRKACEAESNSAHPQFPRDDGSRIYRPLTFKEDIEARVNDYESNTGNDERLRLFNRWLNSCTAVVYKAGTTKFKIIPLSPELVTLPEDFSDAYFPIDYDAIAGTELDRNGAVYNTLLAKSDVLDHPAWRAAVEDDVDLLRTYADIVFTERSADKQMAFWTRNQPANDELRALSVSDLSSSSYANGDDDLYNYGSFLRVAQERTP
jgi:hypothetical protein